jgi:hypothetical protein
MSMKTGWLVAGSVVLACGVVVAAAGSDGQNRRNRSNRDWDDGKNYNFNINTGHRDQPVTSCSELEATVRNGELARDEEVQTVAAPAQGIAVTGAKNGPVYVTGADRNDYQVTLCKFTAADTGDEARAKLANLSLAVDNGRVTVNGPSENGYMAYVIVETPRDARLNVEVTNGPLDLRSLSGHIVARTQNGPLSARDVSGEVDLQAQNGPVSLSDGGGHMRVKARNGPLSVALSGMGWQGAGLEASAQNGPLSLAVPENYGSGVLVNISGNAPFACRGPACQQARRDWDDRSRTLRFGADANPIVNVSASNGPVSIATGRED